MEDENRNPFAKCTGINPLYKLKPIDGNPVSNSIFRNSTGVSNPRNSWIGKRQLKKFLISKGYLRIDEFLWLRPNSGEELQRGGSN
jgi:hypothetical protein